MEARGACAPAAAEDAGAAATPAPAAEAAADAEPELDLRAVAWLRACLSALLAFSKRAVTCACSSAIAAALPSVDGDCAPAAALALVGLADLFSAAGLAGAFCGPPAGDEGEAAGLDAGDDEPALPAGAAAAADAEADAAEAAGGATEAALEPAPEALEAAAPAPVVLAPMGE